MVDYFVIRKTHVRVPDLLTQTESSIYWYSSGINVRAVVALAFSVWMPFRKFFPRLICNYLRSAHIGTCSNTAGWIMVIRNDTSLLDSSWQKIYGLAWMLCFLVAGFIYYALSIVWPM